MTDGNASSDIGGKKVRHTQKIFRKKNKRHSIIKTECLLFCGAWLIPWAAARAGEHHCATSRGCPRLDGRQGDLSDRNPDEDMPVKSRSGAPLHE